MQPISMVGSAAGERPAVREGCPRALEMMNMFFCLKSKRIQASRKDPGAVPGDIRNGKASKRGWLCGPALGAVSGICMKAMPE